MPTVYAVAWCTPVDANEVNDWLADHGEPGRKALDVLAYPHARLPLHLAGAVLVGISVLNMSPEAETLRVDNNTAAWLATDSTRAKAAWYEKASGVHRRFPVSEDEQARIKVAVEDLVELVKDSQPSFKLYRVVTHVASRHVHDWHEQPGEPARDVCVSCGEERY